MKSYAGETLGWHTPLTDGTEVAIAYSNGDIDLPYIAYALHDSGHPDLVNRDNHTRNVLRTPANNKLRMEDRRGEEHIRLATEYGKTQLNSGHLVDSQGQRRGQGTELRTDEWGTIRAGKGLFVSADAQAKAQGEALDIDDALKEIDRLNRQLQQLEMAAEQVQAQNASMRLFAEKKLTMSSASDISFAGKKRITLIGGGSYLRLEAGKIEYGTTATYLRKVKRTMAAGASTLPLESLTQMKMITQYFDRKLHFSSDINFRVETVEGKELLSGSGTRSYIDKGDSESECWVFVS